MDEYKVKIGGLEHTVQYDHDTAERLGLLDGPSEADAAAVEISEIEAAALAAAKQNSEQSDDGDEKSADGDDELDELSGAKAAQPQNKARTTAQNK